MLRGLLEAAAPKMGLEREVMGGSQAQVIDTNLRSYLYHSLPTVGARIPDNVLLRNANWYETCGKILGEVR